MCHFLVTNLEYLLIQWIQYFLRFHYLYYSVRFNECKEKCRIVLCWFLTIKTIVAPLSTSNFPMNLICWGMVVFVCVDKSVPMTLCF